MARHDEREAVVRAEAAGRPLRPWIPSEPRQVRVRHDLALRNASQRLEHAPLELGPAVVVDLHLTELDTLAGEVGAQAVDELIHIRCSRGTDTSALRRYAHLCGWRVFTPTLGGGFTRAHACT